MNNAIEGKMMIVVDDDEHWRANRSIWLSNGSETSVGNHYSEDRVAGTVADTENEHMLYCFA